VRVVSGKKKKGNPVTTRKKEGYYHNRATATAKPARARTGRLAWRLVAALLLLRRPALAAPRGAMDGLGEGEASDPEDDPVEVRQELSLLGPIVIRLLQASLSLESMTER